MLWKVEVMAGRDRTVMLPGADARAVLRGSVSDRAVFWQCLVMRQYDSTGMPHQQRIMDGIARIAAQGRVPLFLDCGANIGLASVWFATQFPSARIIAIEPDAENFKQLSLNAAQFQQRVLPIHGAVGGESGLVDVVNRERGSSGFQVAPAAENSTGAVKSYAIADLVNMVPNAGLVLVKLDVEGSQREIFAGNADWLGDAMAVVIELDDWQFPWQGTSRNFIRAIARYPYEFVLNGENLFCFRDEKA